MRAEVLIEEIRSWCSQSTIWLVNVWLSDCRNARDIALRMFFEIRMESRFLNSLVRLMPNIAELRESRRVLGSVVHLMYTWSLCMEHQSEHQRSLKWLDVWERLNESNGGVRALWYVAVYCIVSYEATKLLSSIPLIEWKVEERWSIYWKKKESRNVE